MSSGIGLDDKCLPAYNELQRPSKPNQKSKFVIYKITPDLKSITVEEVGAADPAQSEQEQYDAFVKKLPSEDCRWAVYDVGFEKDGGKRNKLAFFIWSPDNAKIKSKMLYASSKDALRKALTGIGADVQGTDFDEVAWEPVLAKVSKGN